jgi:hypothetical protein
MFPSGRPPLDGCRAKVAWGKAHGDALKGHLLAWKYLQTEPPFTLRKEFDADLNRFIFYVNTSISLPVVWSLIVGDALNNFRAGLDHLAWFLVNLQPPANLKDWEVFFPIYDTPKWFADNLAKRLPGVDGKFTDIIKRYQPFSTETAAKWIALLAKLNNFDKHRQVRPFIGQTAGNIHVEVIEQSHFTVTKTEPPADLQAFVEYKPDAEVARIYGIPTGTGKPEVKVGIVGSYFVAFENGEPVPEGLDAIEAAVYAVLNDIEAVL